MNRTFDFYIKGRFHSFTEPWVYDCELTDVKTRIQVNEKHHKAPTGALEHAVDKLVNKLQAAGEI
jgi:hypothetical protein